MQQEKTSKEPILVISDIEFDNFSDIEVGDIVLLNDYVKAIADSIKSKNNMVIVKDIIQVQDYNNEAYISFENKNNEIESHPISLFKKLKTYSFSEINHKPGDLFFSLEEVSGIREKNIIYEEIDHENFSKNRIFYKSEDGYASSISRLETIAFINTNNNLDIIENEYKKSNSYLNLIKQIRMENKND